MKYLALVWLFVMLSGCATTSPERLERSKEYEERAERANQLAAALGSREATPDNIKYMERAYEESTAYQKKAYEEKYRDTWGDLLFNLLLGIDDD